MKRLRALLRAPLLPFALLCSAPAQQAPPATIQFQGLRSVDHQGSFGAAAFTPDGNLVLLYNQGDGLRLLKTDPQAQNLLAQIQLGAAGDAGTALATDPSGNLYVAGTSSSGSLPGTSGAAFPSPADTSINGFLAKFDPNLKPLFLTFLGAPHTLATAVAATADAAFITGSTYSPAFPTTSTAAQPSPALDSDGNGFVQRFSPDGTSLLYSTYLTGTGGSTTPAAIAVDSSDNVIIAGSTSSPAFPTTADALQSTRLGSVAGFLTKLTSAGDSFAFSTFVAGSGLSSLAFDTASGNLLATGDLSPGQFPLSTVTSAIANTPYQSFLRLSPDGQTLLDSALLLPGARSAVTPGPNGTAWVTGQLSTPPFAAQSATDLGDIYLLHLNARDAVDQAFRLGGVPTQNSGYAHLTSTSGAAVLNPTGTLLFVPSTLTAQTDPSFVTTQTFDLPLAGNTPPVLPNRVRDLLPATCTSALPCSGSAAFLSAFSTAALPSALSLSAGDLSAILFRNPGTSPATGLSISASGFSPSSNCPQTLPAGSQCAIALAGTGPGALSLTSSTAPSLTVSLPSTTTSAQPLAFDTAEVDFGIVTSAAPTTRTVTITNLTAVPQTFASAADDLPSIPPYTLAETAGTCAGPPQSHTLPANGSCTLTLTLSASPLEKNDGPVHTSWKLGDRDLLLTAITQAASLALSSSVLDFGTQTPGSATALPRYLYLSNGSPAPIDHAPLDLPSNSPFTLTDNCPSTLQPNSVCQIRVAYLQTTAPTLDSISLILDGGLSVLLQGQTVAALTPLASLTPSPLVVSPAFIQFASLIPASEASTEVQSVEVTNPTGNALPFTASVLGDFALQNPCANTLPAGGSCTLDLQFTPSQPGEREGLLTLSAGIGIQPITVPISGTAAPLLTPSGTTIDLGQTSVAEPVVHWVQVQGTFPQISATVSGSAFGVALLADDGNGHGTLPPSAFTPTAAAQCVACWLAIQFLPTSEGNFAANLQLTTDLTGQPTTLSLHGTAIPSTGLLLTATQPDLGAVPVHSTAAAVTFTLTNLLPGAPTITLQSISATGDFAVLPANSPFACSERLDPAASCSISVAFHPTTQGQRTGKLTVQSSAATAISDLTGTGTPDPGIALNPTALTFPLSPGNASITLTNTGASSLTLGPLTASDPAFTVASPCVSLAPSQSCTATITLTSTPSSTSPLLSFAATRPNADETSSYAVPLIVPRTDTLAAFPTQADFGPQPTQLPGTLRQFAIVNTSATPQTLVITSTRNFPLTSPTGCTILPAGGTCSLEVLFLPQGAGPLTGSLTITPSTPNGTSGTPAVLYLQGYGTGTATLAISDGNRPETPVSFDPLTSGATASQTLTLTNTGTIPLSFRRLTFTAPFRTSTACPSQLAPGATCSLSVLYAPTFLQPNATSESVRDDTGTLLLETDDPASPATVYLAGTVTSAAATTATTPTALPTYTLSRSALTFPNTLAGQSSATQTILVTNPGTVPVTFTGAIPSPGFATETTCTILQPAATCTLTAAFTPSADVSNTTLPGTLTLQSDAATPLDFITLLGPSFATPLTTSPTSLNFSSILLGSTASLAVTLTNITDLPLAFGQASAQGDFALTGGTCPAAGATLAPDASCTFLVTFKPTAPGMRTGTLSVPTDASTQALLIPLQGTALAGHLQASPTTLDFGTLNLTASALQTLTLNNTGTADLTALSFTLTGPNAPDFTSTTTCGPTLPIAASCTFQITFAPSAPGARTSTLSLTSSDPGSPTLVALTGTGAQPPGIVLTVNGADTASATLASGASASFALTLTPQGGYAAGVALTCAAITPAPNATCSLSLSNIDALNQPAQITARLTTENGFAASPFALSLLPTLPWLLRRRRSKHMLPRTAAILTACLVFSVLLASCANGPSSTGNPYTPPGAYLYQVTATSTSGPPLSSTVTLALTVQ